jgi:hypothetical protein
MKRNVAIALALLLMTACSKEATDEPQGRWLTVNTSAWTQETRAGLDADGKSMTDLWLMDYKDGSLVQTIHQASTDDNFGSVSLYATYGAHVFYLTASRGSSPAVDETAHTITWEKPSDTFWQPKALTVDANTTATSVAMDRVAARLSVRIDDAIPSAATTMTVTTDKWRKGLDYMTGEPTDGVAQNYSMTLQQGTPTMICYTLAPASGTMTTGVTVGVADANGQSLGSAAGGTVRLSRNKQTLLHGNLFGSSPSLTVSLNDVWGGSDEQSW